MINAIFTYAMQPTLQPTDKFMLEALEIDLANKMFDDVNRIDNNDEYIISGRLPIRMTQTPMDWTKFKLSVPKAEGSGVFLMSKHEGHRLNDGFLEASFNIPRMKALEILMELTASEPSK